MDQTLSNVSLNQIMIFLTVAESGGFLKASEELHLTQSAVSKSIAKLEKELNLCLFQRTTRALKLTKEGRLLFEAWKPQFLAMQTAYRHIMQIVETDFHTLKIGLLNTAKLDLYFWEIQKRFQALYPHVHLSLDSAYMLDLEKKLSDGEYDLIFIPDFEHYTLDELGLPWTWAKKTTARLLLSRKNPLSQKESVTLNELIDQNFVSLRESSSDNYIRDLHERFSEYNATPNITSEYSSAYSLRNIHHPTEDVIFVDQYFDNIVYEDIVQIPVTDQLNGIICAWSPNTKEDVLLFLEVVQSLSEIDNI